MVNALFFGPKARMRRHGGGKFRIVHLWHKATIHWRGTNTRYKAVTGQPRGGFRTQEEAQKWLDATFDEDLWLHECRSLGDGSFLTRDAEERLDYEWEFASPKRKKKRSSARHHKYKQLEREWQALKERR